MEVEVKGFRKMSLLGSGRGVLEKKEGFRNRKKTRQRKRRMKRESEKRRGKKRNKEKGEGKK